MERLCNGIIAGDTLAVEADVHDFLLGSIDHDRRAAPRLAAAIKTSPVPFVLMLDDLHELRSLACHDVLSVVLSGVPWKSQLVAASDAVHQATTIGLLGG